MNKNLKLIMYASIFAGLIMNIYIFYSIIMFGQITALEPNKFILYSEAILFTIVLILFTPYGIKKMLGEFEDEE